ncbi:unnamed protein product [Orchesella dallaii]|uniref:Uncharacterized protein n=1 Tax=Orchesella dallaii TaxID=48710 RepID=A0ABP1QTV7_9HEXA
MSSKTSKFMVQLVVVVLLGILSVVLAGVGDGGSRCADASCTPAPEGVQCDPKYERDDGCCPVWYCNNGQQVYGVSRGSSQSSGTSWSSSSSSGGGGLPDPGFSNMFGNLFGNLFGR